MPIFDTLGALLDHVQGKTLDQTRKYLCHCMLCHADGRGSAPGVVGVGASMKVRNVLLSDALDLTKAQRKEDHTTLSHANGRVAHWPFVVVSTLTSWFAPFQSVASKPSTILLHPTSANP